MQLASVKRWPRLRFAQRAGYARNCIAFEGGHMSKKAFATRLVRQRSAAASSRIGCVYFAQNAVHANKMGAAKTAPIWSRA